MSDFISDEEMKKLEANSAPAETSSHAPDFISDDEIHKYDDRGDTALTSSPSGLASAVKGAAIGGGLGAGAGWAIGKANKGAAKAANGLFGALGDLSTEQMNKITSDPKAYHSARNLEDILTQYHNLGKDVATNGKVAGDRINNIITQAATDTNKAGYKLAEEARTLLDNQPRVSKDQLYKGVVSGLNKNPGIFDDVTPESRMGLINEHYQKPLEETQAHVAKKIQNLSEQARYLKHNIDNAPESIKKGAAFQGLLKDYAKTQYDLDQAHLNLLQHPDTLVDNTKQAIKKFTGVPDELATHFDGKRIKPEFQKQINDVINQINSDKYSSGVGAISLGDRGGLIDSVQDSANWENGSASKIKNDLAKNIAEGLREQAGQALPEWSEKRKASSKAINANKALQDATNVELPEGFDPEAQIGTNKAKKVQKQLSNPEVFKTENANIMNALDQAKPFTQDYGHLPAVQDRLVQTEKLANDLKEFGLKIDPTTGQVSPLDAGGKAKFVKTMTGADQDVKGRLIDAINRATQLSSSPVTKTGTDLAHETDLANIKNIVNGPKDLSQGTVNKLSNTVGKGVVASVAGLPAAIATMLASAGLDKYGTKIQEGYAGWKGSNFGKGAAKVGDAISNHGTKVGGAIGAGLGLLSSMNDANAQDNLTPVEKGATTILDMANPVTMTSVPQAYSEGKKALNDYGAARPDLIAGKAVAGFVDPAINAVKNAYNAVPEATRQVLNAPDVIVPAAINGVKSLFSHDDKKDEVTKTGAALKQATPEQLMELSKTFKDIKGANALVAPLENAAQSGSPEERNARLFGLYQQPAFRQLLKKNNSKGQ